MKREQIGRLFCMLIALLTVFALYGCWDYQGLGEQTIVAGIAVDLEEDSGFSLTFEIVDLNGGEGGQFGSILLTTTGETLAEAVHDARNRLHSEVYLGVADVVVVGRSLAEQVGITPLVRYLMQDKTARSSLYIVVAGTESAAELFAPAETEGEGEDHDAGQAEGPGTLLSKVLGESLNPHRRGAGGATVSPAAYEVYHILSRDTSDLVLPIIGPSEAEDIPFQLDGLALFTGDRMNGTLPKDDLFAYLLAGASLREQVFPVEVNGERAVLAIRRSRVLTDFDLAGGRLQFFLNIRVTADAAQLPEGWGEMDRETIRQLETEAERALSNEVLTLIERLRDEGRDIFGLAETIWNREPELWRRIAEDWRVWLGASEINVRAEVEVET